MFEDLDDLVYTPPDLTEPKKPKKDKGRSRPPKEEVEFDPFPMLSSPPPSLDYFPVVPKADELLVLIDEGDGAVDPDRDLTPEQRVFLQHYMSSGVVTTALRKSGMSRKKYDAYMSFEGRFSKAVMAATEAISDSLEGEALKQAMTGNTKVLLKLLESYKPQKFGRVSTVQQLIDGKVEHVHTWAELAQKALNEPEPPVEVEAEVVKDEP